MIALERAGPICGSLSSSVAVAVLRLVLAACGAVAAPVVAGFAGAPAAGAGFAGCAGCIPCAKAGADRSASVAEVTRTRRINIAVVLSLMPCGSTRANAGTSQAGVARIIARLAGRTTRLTTDIADRSRTRHGRRVHPRFTRSTASKELSQFPPAMADRR